MNAKTKCMREIILIVCFNCIEPLEPVMTVIIFAGKCLFLSGLVPRPMNAENDRELLNFGIGFTNIVERTTRANQELSRQEIEEGKKYF